MLRLAVCSLLGGVRKSQIYIYSLQSSGAPLVLLDQVLSETLRQRLFYCCIFLPDHSLHPSFFSNSFIIPVTEGRLQQNHCLTKDSVLDWFTLIPRSGLVREESKIRIIVTCLVNQTTVVNDNNSEKKPTDLMNALLCCSEEHDRYHLSVGRHGQGKNCEVLLHHLTPYSKLLSILLVCLG